MLPGREPDHYVPITGGVLNYCDPLNFSHPEFEEQVLGRIIDSNWKLAIGIHPKQAAEYTQGQWECFLKLLSNPRVSAISEVGFDFTVKKHLWRHQEELMDRILSLGTLGRILVMHLRGADDDKYSKVVNRLALRRLKRKCLPHQRVHLHCFTSDVSMVHAWNEAFPHCYFGITGKVRSFNEDQLAALREIPLNRLLLETDSPHLKLHPGCTYNTPYYLGDVGYYVARARGVPLAEIIGATYTNAQRLYC
ncbi:putative deoxyribonuclease TATDN2 [Lytechinus variegatus]|uniref:putative deoxyribonuclease TATDN2 n=1 Tax=Lytechinus variegatus TaxID=7654 RepID=UPI001BB1C8CB|nr:putative deoxyribonuclease TATDN2 [Lytechinus variegatus]